MLNCEEQRSNCKLLPYKATRQSAKMLKTKAEYTSFR
jgi:hypothetical protein